MKSGGQESLGRVRRTGGAGGEDTGGDGMGGKGVFGTARGGGLATNCVSCCSCVVRAARVELMLHFVSLLAHEDDVAGTLRRRLRLGGCPEATTSRERSFRRAGYDRGG